MKNVTELRKLFFACMVVGSTVVLSSCSDDDDDKTPTAPTLTDVYGDYNGKMLVTALEAPESDKALREELTGTDVAAVVKSDTVYFDNLPITELVAGIVGDEAAAGIVEKIGKVTFKVGYTAALTTAQDSIYMTFDPKPLVLELPGEGEETTKVTVTIATPKKGSYEVASKKLAFELNAETVTLGEVDFPAFTPSQFSFKLNKK